MRLMNHVTLLVMYFTCILQSLCGHTTPVESLAFDSTEVLVLGGASSGTVKLWDLEEAKSEFVKVLTLI